MFSQPFLNQEFQLPQLAPVGAEYRQVIHIACVMGAQTALPYHYVKRLQNCVGEPLRGIRTNQDAAADDPLDEVKNTAVFDELAHTCHYDLRLQAVVEVPDVAA